MRRVAPLFACLLLAACNRPEPTPAAPPQGGEAAATQGEGTPQPVALAELSAGQIVTPEVSSTCNLEMIDGVLVPDASPIEPKARVFPVSGWAVDDVARRAPPEIQIRIASQTGDGRVWSQTAVPAIDRTDVQQIQGGAPELLKSGFAAEIDTSALPAGEYRVRIAYQRDGKEVACDNGRGVVLK
jgi:hypothetical protein